VRFDVQVPNVGHDERWAAPVMFGDRSGAGPSVFFAPIDVAAWHARPVFARIVFQETARSRVLRPVGLADGGDHALRTATARIGEPVPPSMLSGNPK